MGSVHSNNQHDIVTQRSQEYGRASPLHGLNSPAHVTARPHIVSS
jgi:hypothetical protein